MNKTNQDLETVELQQPAVASKDGLSSLLVDETKILKWWRCKRHPGGRAVKSRARWEAQRFTFGQRRNMEKYHTVQGPFETEREAQLAA